MEENKKLEAIMNVFKELSYEEKREKVISLVEWLGESEVYLRDFNNNKRIWTNWWISKKCI